MILETERLILRPWEDSDAEALYKYASDPRVGPAAGWPVHTSVENSREVIRCVLSEPETYAVCLKETGEPIGSIGLIFGGGDHPAMAPGEAELGYWLGVPYWGRGLMPEAAREMIRHAFVDLHMHTMWCAHFDENDKSRRVQEKCGFTYHHTVTDMLWSMTGRTVTEHFRRLTREEWKESFAFRRLTDAETPSALALSWKVFSAVEAPLYGKRGTEEFRGCLQDEKYLADMVYYGAFDLKTLVGVIGIRRSSAHLCFFFVDGAYRRLGIGTGLFRAMRADFAGRSITLNASPFGLPFYYALGFTAAGKEQTVNGIRFTPMLLEGADTEWIYRLSERRDLAEAAAQWFSEKWGLPAEAYLDSIRASFTAEAVPEWYVCVANGHIVAGMGVIENDFHNRPDLTPNVCAVYTEPDCRGRGLCGRLLDYVCRDMNARGIGTLYLLTDHTGFYERYGWEYLCPVYGDGEDTPSRMYIHRAESGTTGE